MLDWAPPDFTDHFSRAGHPRQHSAPLPLALAFSLPGSWQPPASLASLGSHNGVSQRQDALSFHGKVVVGGGLHEWLL